MVTCTVTDTVFWGGILRKPGDKVQYTGKAENMPRQFEREKKPRQKPAEA